MQTGAIASSLGTQQDFVRILMGSGMIHSAWWIWTEANIVICGN